MLDLSAAFDTLGHGILFHRFENLFGISGAALGWIASYLHDTQLYISFKPKDGAAQTDSLELIERCLTDIERWMRVNMLKLNSEKSEVVLFTSKHNVMQMENVTVRVGNTDITSVNSVKNLSAL